MIWPFRNALIYVTGINIKHFITLSFQIFKHIITYNTKICLTSLKKVKSHMLKQAKGPGMGSALHWKECSHFPIKAELVQRGRRAAPEPGISPTHMPQHLPSRHRHLLGDDMLPTAKNTPTCSSVGYRHVTSLVLRSANGLWSAGWHLLRHCREQRCVCWRLSSQGGLDERSQKRMTEHRLYGFLP